MLVMGDEDGVLRRMEAGGNSGPPERSAHDGPINCLVYSSEDGLLVSGCANGSLGLLWDRLPASEAMRYLQHDSSPILCAAFSPTLSGVVATGNAAGFVREWNSRDGILLQEWQAGTEAMKHPPPS